jgi:hypothetical protein
MKLKCGAFIKQKACNCQSLLQLGRVLQGDNGVSSPKLKQIAWRSPGPETAPRRVELEETDNNGAATGCNNNATGL